jgi:hypothetical protein
VYRERAVCAGGESNFAVSSFIFNFISSFSCAVGGGKFPDFKRVGADCCTAADTSNRTFLKLY